MSGVALAFVAALSAPSASATTSPVPVGGADNLVVDGSFEYPTEVTPGGFQWFVFGGGGGTLLGAWTVNGNADELVGASGLQPQDGSQSVELDGGIYQYIPTTPGQTYTLTFWEAGDPRGPPTVKKLAVIFGHFEASPSFSTAATTPTAMGWVMHQYEVKATAKVTWLDFDTRTIYNSGPLIDDVSLTKGKAVKSPSPSPKPSPSGPRHPGAAGLAAEWNKPCGDCGSGIPDLSAHPGYFYDRLLLATQRELDSNAHAAAAFFAALNSYGLATFVYVSQHFVYSVVLAADFPRKLVSHLDPDGLQLLAIAIGSRDRSEMPASLATKDALAFVDPVDCVSCASTNPAWTDGLATVSAMAVIYNWDPSFKPPVNDPTRLGDLQTLVQTAASGKVGWNIVNLGAAAYAAKSLPTSTPRGKFPSQQDLTTWVDNVNNWVAAPLEAAVKANWVNGAENDSLSSQTTFTGISTIVATAIPVPLLGSVIGLALGLWGVNASDIPTGVDQGVSFDQEAHLNAALWVIEALLLHHRIMPTSHFIAPPAQRCKYPDRYPTHLENTKSCLFAAFEDYLNNGGNYVVKTSVAPVNGAPGTTTTTTETLTTLIGPPLTLNTLRAR